MEQLNKFLPIISVFTNEQIRLIKKKMESDLKEKYDSIREGFIKNKKYRENIISIIKENYKELIEPYQNINVISYKPTEIEKISIVLTKESHNIIDDRISNYKGYLYLKSESNKQVCVYRYKTFWSDNIFICFRGTKDLDDIIPDYHIFRNQQHLSKRFENALLKFDSIQQKYPNSKIYVSGFSLGGMLSIWVQKHRQNCHQCYAFNPGYNGYFISKINLNHSKIKIFIVKGDIISNTILALNKDMQPDKKNLIILAGTKSIYNNHDFSNFMKLV